MWGQQWSIDWLLVLPALVGVQYGYLLGRDGPEDFLEHGANQVEHGSFAFLVGHNLTVVEIHHRRKVQLLAVDVELSHIGYPFLARTHRVELTIQQVR